MSISRVRVLVMSTVTSVILIVTALLLMPVAYAEGSGDKYYDGVIDDSAAVAVYDDSLMYTRKEVLIDKSLDPATPQYVNKNVAFQNACAAVAGSILVGYGDYLYPDLIPAYDSFIKRGPKVIFKPMSGEMQTILEDLHVRMKTNHISPGTTEADFKLGLSSYVQDNGRSIQYISYGGGSNIDYDGIAAQLGTGQPIAVFATLNHIIKKLEIGDTSMRSETVELNVDHIMIADGIKRVRYYNGSQLLRTDTYLSISTGIEVCPRGYIRLETTAELDDIVGIDIR